MPDRDAWLARLDPANDLHVHSQTSSCPRLLRYVSVTAFHKDGARCSITLFCRRWRSGFADLAR